MIHDKSICKECRYNNIKEYSLKLRHCNKCDNYGEKVLKANVRVIQRPVKIGIDCPHCDYEIEMRYSNFEYLMLSDYPGDWIGKKIECPNCEKEIEIEDNEWD
ncbi:hypothetical protein PMY12_14935 [Clostridium tertium]|uniref:hypothetical protein n=1 Tax=Clostridium tertium TaxID=1559 RepID=UPI00232DD21A|nr:hypothetical protein [Clostridium tertium]MDB1935373.1 hypothetical protein [Clostridium tertium]MDB1938299.1 hypothetical protein [Clostridium tertium]